MTYHASYEQALAHGVTKVVVTGEDGVVWISTHNSTRQGETSALDPTAARWLSERLREAAEEMEGKRTEVVECDYCPNGGWFRRNAS